MCKLRCATSNCIHVTLDEILLTTEVAEDTEGLERSVYDVGFWTLYAAQCDAPLSSSASSVVNPV
jgi:hypothetical protein